MNPPSRVARSDDELTRATFSWAEARSWMDGLPGGGLNIAHEAVDRHATGPRGTRVALRLLGKHGERREVTYRELSGLTNRFANVLDGLGVERGERVFVLLPRVRELYLAVLGTLKHASVACTLFSAFGPEPIRQRLALGDARVLVTTAPLYQRKVAAIRGGLPGLAHVLIAGPARAPAGTVSLDELMADASERYEIPPTGPEDPALLHFTSGTTGPPKGAVHVHAAVIAHHATGRLALDLHPEDAYWCTADQGWVTGVSYGILAPLTHGLTVIADEGDFDADRWYRILQDERVTVWYTSPTAVRMLMRVGAEVAHEYDLSALRVAASVGEALDADAVTWGLEAFGRPIHDNWWQTETGAIMIANPPGQPIRPGSMGRPLPGVEATVLETDDEGQVVHPRGTPTRWSS